jgi:hypothetical protein
MILNVWSRGVARWFRWDLRPDISSAAQQDPELPCGMARTTWPKNSAAPLSPSGRQIYRAPVDALHRKLRRRVRVPYKSNYRLAALPLLWHLRLVLFLDLGLRAELLLSVDRAALFISCCPAGSARGNKTAMKRTTPNL